MPTRRQEQFQAFLRSPEVEDIKKFVAAQQPWYHHRIDLACCDDGPDRFKNRYRVSLTTDGKSRAEWKTLGLFNNKLEAQEFKKLMFDTYVFASNERSIMTHFPSKRSHNMNQRKDCPECKADNDRNEMASAINVVSPSLVQGLVATASAPVAASASQQ